MCVKNVQGTSSSRYQISGLSQKYERAAGCYPDTCQVYGCSKQATATAHVRMDDGRRGGQWGVVPTCAEHNNYSNTSAMYLKQSAKVVPVSKIRK